MIPASSLLPLIFFTQPFLDKLSALPPTHRGRFLSQKSSKDKNKQLHSLIFKFYLLTLNEIYIIFWFPALVTLFLRCIGKTLSLTHSTWFNSQAQFSQFNKDVISDGSDPRMEGPLNYVIQWSLKYATARLKIHSEIPVRSTSTSAGGVARTAAAGARQSHAQN